MDDEKFIEMVVFRKCFAYFFINSCAVYPCLFFSGSASGSA